MRIDNIGIREGGGVCRRGRPVSVLCQSAPVSPPRRSGVRTGFSGFQGDVRRGWGAIGTRLYGSWRVGPRNKVEGLLVSVLCQPFPISVFLDSVAAFEGCWGSRRLSPERQLEGWGPEVVNCRNNSLKIVIKLNLRGAKEITKRQRSLRDRGVSGMKGRDGIAVATRYCSNSAVRVPGAR